MKLFIAVGLPESLKEKIFQSYLNRIPKEKFSVVKKKNLHVTICFLGEIPEEDLPGIASAFQKVSIAPFTALASGIGSFTDRIVWVGLGSGTEEFKELAKLVCDTFNVPTHRFHAHITLARNKRAGSKEFGDIFEKLSRNKIAEEFEVRSILLVRSTLSEEGPDYEVLSERTF